MLPDRGIIETLFERVFEMLPEGVLMTDCDRRVVAANTAFCHMFGYEPSEVTGADIDTLVASEDKLFRDARDVTSLIESGEPVLVDAVRRRKDGSLFPVTIHSMPLREKPGDSLGFNIAIYHTLQRNVLEENGDSRNNHFSTMMLAKSPNPVLVVNPDTSIRYVNHAFEELTGFHFRELAGRKTPYPWWTEDKEEFNRDGLLQAMNNGYGSTRREYVFRKRKGDLFWIEATGVPVFRRGVFNYYLSNWVDITARKKAEADLAHIARHDQLTGLFNRYYFNEYMEKELRRSNRFDHPVAFLMLDVDGFKNINDNFGHQTGDMVLREVAACLRDVVRDVDTVVRYGGDEFLVVLVETNGEKDIVRERMRDEFRKRGIGRQYLGYPVTVSIGGSHMEPGTEKTLEEVLAAADKDMYAEKERKKKETG